MHRILLLCACLLFAREATAQVIREKGVLTIRCLAVVTRTPFLEGQPRVEYDFQFDSVEHRFIGAPGGDWTPPIRNFPGIFLIDPATEQVYLVQFSGDNKFKVGFAWEMENMRLVPFMTFMGADHGWYTIMPSDLPK